MRRPSLLVAVVFLVAFPAVALGAGHIEPMTLSATLSADVEVPAPTVPSDFAGSGSAEVTINVDDTIDYEVSYEGLTGAVVGAHIHYAPPGEAGGVIFPLAHGASPFSGTLTEADFTPLDGGPQTFEEALNAIRAGDTYINLHTAANESGEVRGQLEALPDTATASAGNSATSFGPPLSSIILAIVGVGAFVFATRRLVRA